MQEEFSCQVMQGIGQSCTYRVYAVRCGNAQNRVPSEPVEVHVPGMIASYPVFPIPIFHTASDKNLGVGNAGYEATHVLFHYQLDIPTPHVHTLCM